MVAANEDHPCADGAQARQGVLAQRDGVQRRDGPVVNVARDQHGVDLLRAGGLDEVVKENGLSRAQVGTVQVAAQVPVGGVQEPHGVTIAAPTDIRGSILPTADVQPGELPAMVAQRTRVITEIPVTTVKDDGALPSPPRAGCRPARSHRSLTGEMNWREPLLQDTA
jgi:hypothetical protein